MANIVHALQESGDLKPDGDCYAPQILLTLDHGGRWNATELNTDSLPFTAEQFLAARNELGTPELACRWAWALGCSDARYRATAGYAQGDRGESYVFSTPEWLEMTGAPGLTDADHGYLCAWAWGDVYEVWEDGEEDSFIVYGMEAAREYGEILYPQQRITTYWA